MAGMTNSRSPVIRAVAVAVLTLVLLIPISMISGVVDERKQRRNEAVAEITSTWGNPQLLVGPVLVVPFHYRYRVPKDEIINGRVVKNDEVLTGTDFAYFLPAELKIDADVQPKKLHRGIYEAVVYTGKVALSGKFAAPDWKALKIEPEDVLWNDAVVTAAIPDLRGARGALELSLGGKTYAMKPGSKVPGFGAGAHALVGEAARGERLDFGLAVDLNGSRDIRFAPFGVRNLVTVKSPWPDPKFSGGFLPVEREVGKDGFTAKWDVSYYGRSWPQAATSRGGGVPEAGAVENASFGVEFLSSVDSYRNVERATKYGILFIAMVFAAFFLFEVLAGLSIHPIQYLLVGLALALFFLILLSLSEFAPFGAAYWIAALTAAGLIVGYCARILGEKKRAGILAAELAAVYGYLFVVLQLQDFSLLMGSALLVGTLGTIMYLTRGVDWYALDKSEA